MQVATNASSDGSVNNGVLLEGVKDTVNEPPPNAEKQQVEFEESCAEASEPPPSTTNIQPEEFDASGPKESNIVKSSTSQDVQEESNTANSTSQDIEEDVPQGREAILGEKVQSSRNGSGEKCVTEEFGKAGLGGGRTSKLCVWRRAAIAVVFEQKLLKRSAEIGELAEAVSVLSLRSGGAPLEVPADMVRTVSHWKQQQAFRRGGVPLEAPAEVVGVSLHGASQDLLYSESITHTHHQAASASAVDSSHSAIEVGDSVVVTRDKAALRRSFESTPHIFKPAMTTILGRTMEVLEVREGGATIGLEEAEKNSGTPVWYYSSSILTKVCPALETSGTFPAPAGWHSVGTLAETSQVTHARRPRRRRHFVAMKSSDEFLHRPFARQRVTVSSLSAKRLPPIPPPGSRWQLGPDWNASDSHLQQSNSPGSDPKERTIAAKKIQKVMRSMPSLTREVMPTKTTPLAQEATPLKSTKRTSHKKVKKYAVEESAPSSLVGTFPAVHTEKSTPSSPVGTFPAVPTEKSSPSSSVGTFRRGLQELRRIQKSLRGLSLNAEKSPRSPRSPRAQSPRAAPQTATEVRSPWAETHSTPASPRAAPTQTATEVRSPGAETRSTPALPRATPTQTVTEVRSPRAETRSTAAASPRSPRPPATSGLQRSEKNSENRGLLSPWVA